MPIIIKRYRNRKLYNTQTKRYITLQEIEGLIKEHEEIKVIENDTGNDITATTLSQIIFGLEKSQTGVLPIDFLLSLVQTGGKRFEEIRRNLLTSLNFTHHFEAELERRINLLVSSNEMTQEEGRILFSKMLSLESRQGGAFNDLEGKLLGFVKEQQIPTKDDVNLLMTKLDELSQMVEELSSPTETKSKSDAKHQIIE